MQGIDETKTKGKATDFDKKIGSAIRHIRTYKGVTQQDLAKKIGVTFQQLQKYEKGTNRVSVSRLHLLSEALEFDLSDFFHSLQTREKADKSAMQIFDVNDKQTLELISLFSEIKDPQIKRSFLGILKGYSKNKE